MAKPKCLVCGGPMDKGHRQAVLDEVVRLRDAERRLVELQEAVRTLRKLEQGIPSTDSAFIHKFVIEEARAAVDALVGQP